MRNIIEEFNSKIKPLNEGAEFLSEFNSKLSSLNEVAVRGRSVGGFRGVKNQWKDAIAGLSYGVLNRSSRIGTEVAKYNFNNFYSLDIRVPIDKLLREFNNSEGKSAYTTVFNNLYISEGLEAIMIKQLRTTYAGAMSDMDTKDALKDAFNDLQRSREKNSDEDGTSSPNRLQPEHVDLFDELSGLLLREAMSDEDIEEGTKLLQKLGIKVGDKLKYTTRKEKIVPVTVTDLPTNLGGRETTPGALQVRYKSKDGKSSKFAIPIVTNSKPTIEMDTDGGDYGDEEHQIWRLSLKEILSHPKIGDAMMVLYDGLPIISMYTGGGGEELAIKNEIPELNKTGFVPYVMDALTSAVRGTIPQGVTIEEIMAGKFSTKPVASEQGSFINRIKDQTSGKEISFRAQNDETLEHLHNYIMTTFRHDSFNTPLPNLDETLTKSITRRELVLYMTQSDFLELEKGGEAVSKALGKVGNVIGDYIATTSEPVDF